MSKPPSLETLPRTQLSRRDLLGLAAKGAASVVVSQSLLVACASGGNSSADTTTTALTGSTSSALPAGNPTCVLTAALTEGPFFVDEKLNRADIRADPVTGAVSAGIPLALKFNVWRVANNACTPLTGAYLDVWHCDAGGVYSDVPARRRNFCAAIRSPTRMAPRRSYHIPGWYRGRAVHIHFMLRLFAGSTKSYEFTSQFFSTTRSPTQCTVRARITRAAQGQAQLQRRDLQQSVGRRKSGSDSSDLRTSAATRRNRPRRQRRLIPLLAPPFRVSS